MNSTIELPYPGQQAGDVSLHAARMPDETNLTGRAEREAIPCVLGHNKLLRRMSADQGPEPLYLELTGRLGRDVSDVAAFMDLGVFAEVLGSRELGIKFRSTALTAQTLYRLASAGTPRLRLLGLAIEGRLTANMPIEFLLEDSDVELTWMFLEPGVPLPPIPDHDLAIVLVAEREEARPWLSALEARLPSWPRPILNRPECVPLLGRETLFKLMAGVEGVIVPPTVRVDARRFAAIGEGRIPIAEVLSNSAFPILARPVDSHAGYGLKKLDSVAGIGPYLQQQSHPAYHLSGFVEYSSPDGLSRKYRIAVIDGEPFPSHLAISEHWMIHFMKAGMEESALKRQEEAEFMERFQEDFGKRHRHAFVEMATRSGLDYFVVDCGETREGALLVFEADTAHIVHSMDSPELFPYKVVPMQNVFEAFRSLLFRKAGCLSGVG
jgi:hypothetical protein